MAHLVDDYPDHAVLGTLRVGTVFLRAPIVETDHRVLHADLFGVNAVRNRVWVREGIVRVPLEGMRHGFGTVLFPERITLFRIHRSRHDGRAVLLLHGHRVPDEFTRRSKREVAHIVGLELPGFGTLRPTLLSLLGFGLVMNHHRLHEAFLSLFPAFPLRFAQYVIHVLYRTGGCDKVVGGCGNLYLVVAED